jgi:hypothetical protein
MLVGPGFVFPFLHEVKKPFPFQFLMGYRAFDLDFAVSHFDDFPVSSPGAALDGDFVAQLGGIQAKHDDPVAALAVFGHNALLCLEKFV